jgi:hypothetical protein
MRIEKNTSGYGKLRPGDGYLITGAPAVADIPAGGVWAFWCDVACTDGEDVICLLDLSETEALAFASDEEYDVFIEARSFDINFDNSQTSAPIPKNLFSRASSMFSVAESVWDELWEARLAEKNLG